MGSSLAVPEEQGLGLFKGSACLRGLPAADMLTNKSGNLGNRCTIHTCIHTHWYTHKL